MSFLLKRQAYIPIPKGTQGHIPCWEALVVCCVLSFGLQGANGAEGAESVCEGPGGLGAWPHAVSLQIFLDWGIQAQEEGSKRWQQVQWTRPWFFAASTLIYFPGYPWRR